MIKLIEEGKYKLVETKKFTKVLYLNDKAYAWVEFEGVGELLVTTLKQHSVGAVFSEGRYRIYDVEDEPSLVDHQHLELEIGGGDWQGYLLITGLPDSDKIRARVIPTHEIITTDSILKQPEESAVVAAK